ncbi:hypothetical protein LX36DRAFT_246018 [Colletotrichum falcatum]|nr:hypothetical protein LX36DRAFT_246018 [Colletotrichum falcatum]
MKPSTAMLSSPMFLAPITLAMAVSGIPWSPADSKHQAISRDGASNRQTDKTPVAFLPCHRVEDSCLPQWHVTLQWCQDHPDSDRCPWLPWNLAHETFRSDNGDTLRVGLEWALDTFCLLFPDACSSFKVEDAMNVLSNIDLKNTVQALQDSLGARCEASPLLCPYVPLTMEAMLSAMELVSDVTKLVQAVLDGAGHEKLGRRAIQSDQPPAEDTSKAVPVDIIEWIRSMLSDMCENEAYPWCQFVPGLLDFVQDMFQCTEKDTQR